ncbi:Pentatricopeptide repeat [Dillenia turbinata]|uniref:Pentatricopeptide repeat n=1 Tax=Dillenia turbinata TaxID=194707 RepID=A0AAN8UAD4_9MAGN
MGLAIKVFNQFHHPNVHLYNTLIRAHAQNSQPFSAFSVFCDMQNSGLFPDNFTYPFLLKSFSGQSWLKEVQMIHTHVEKFGLCSDIFVPNALIDSYCKCGYSGVNAARKLFATMGKRDIVSWNSMIGGLVKGGELTEARRLFDEMPERDSVSWNTMLDVYVKAGDINAAFEFFERIPERNVVSWSTMVLGFCKAGDMDMARILFDNMPVKNLVPWTILISGYAEKGLAKEAVGLYNQMEEVGLAPDEGAIVSILAACAGSGLLGLGKRVHASIRRTRNKFSILVGNALVDMYAKCGSLEKAFSIFNDMEKRDVVSWNAMLQGLAMHGCGERALHLFTRMIEKGVSPDKVTLVAVLCACTHAGLTEKGLNYFYTMERDYGVVPQVEHYGCMIDLLGRGGRLKEAFDLVRAMSMEPNAIIWGTLLGACRMHNDVELAEEVLDRLVKLEPSDPGNFSMLSNIYAAARDWDNVASARLKMKSMGVEKPSGASSIEVENEVHEFTVFDDSHRESDKIYQMINGLGDHLKQEGYMPKTCY